MPLFCLQKKEKKKKREKEKKKLQQVSIAPVKKEIRATGRALSDRQTPMGLVERVRIVIIAFYDVWITVETHIKPEHGVQGQGCLPQTNVALGAWENICKRISKIQLSNFFFLCFVILFSSFGQKLAHWLYLPGNT